MSMEELSLTPRDIDILKNVFQCFTSPDALKVSQDHLPRDKNRTFRSLLLPVSEDEVSLCMYCNLKLYLSLTLSIKVSDSCTLLIFSS